MTYVFNDLKDLSCRKKTLSQIAYDASIDSTRCVFFVLTQLNILCK